MAQFVTRTYQHQFDLKYGCNPHQQPAAIHTLEGSDLPFEILNGRPGYINLLDALNAWQLVLELDEATGLPAATSFKHVSPAGAAVAVDLDDTTRQMYECADQELSPLATAYLRARNADPVSSFGDFIALSRKVDLPTAQIIKPMVSDGVIAPDYDQEALKLLTGKKKGHYVVLKGQVNFQAPEEEFREVCGVGFMQKRNSLKINPEQLFGNLVTESKNLTEAAKRDLMIAAIAIKYTQSNSVGYAVQGQMIGIGAGQQSRIDCTKLAGRKADIWFLRRHPKVMALPFKPTTKKVDKINARVRYIEDDMTFNELKIWRENFEEVPDLLSPAEKGEFLKNMQGVSLASDAFFPFRDNIDQASQRGVAYITQPGNSVRDDVVIQAANEYNMVMAFSGLRLFHH